MDIHTFLTECMARGIKINTDGDKIQVEHHEPLKPSTADYIRKHKQQIINELSDQKHGACVRCSRDTQSMLTKPGQPWCWMCVNCFDQKHEAYDKHATAAIL